MENYINHRDRNYPVYVLSGLFIVPFPLMTLQLTSTSSGREMGKNKQNLLICCFVSKPGTLDALEQESMPVRNYRLADSRLSDALDG